MFTLITSCLAISLLSITVMMVSTILSKKTFMDREKNSPFECGFDPKNSPRLPFSLQFFLVAVIFLIFDIEIALLIPFIMIIKFSSLKSLSIMISFFISILLIGLYHEWNQGALEWAL
uniref:NADH-ubiquinone oxidoreductase chain 3 n=1 Tax=Figulus binodulus TaxID=273949 RepID=A0A5J6KBG0_9SCAR|nr:NADH dehydrogenase subunit 3 [Figulus binodulus]QEV84366.1 NADH dehydrogenase subunit 3 [Figulus binodulus]